MAFRQSAAQGVSVHQKWTVNTHPRTRLRLVSVSQWRQIQKGLVVVVYDMDRLRHNCSEEQVTQDLQACFHQESTEFKWYGCFRVMNDPTAGSPTVTLLRLHLPLNDEVWANSHGRAPMKVLSHDPETSPNHSIGRCDGRCVQRAGT